MTDDARHKKLKFPSGVMGRGICFAASSFRSYPASIFLILLASLLSVSTAAAVDRIRIAVSNPNMPNLTVAMAQQKGFFKDENIEAEIIRMNPNVAVTALATGDIDYCQLFGGWSAARLPACRSESLPAILDNWPMTLIAQPEIKSLKELKGKTLGISSFGATPGRGGAHDDPQAVSIRKKTSKFSRSARTRRGLTALKARVVDVVVISPPADTQMEKQGYRILARAYELFSLPYLGLGTHTRKIKERPDEIIRVIKATIRANRSSATTATNPCAP